LAPSTPAAVVCKATLPAQQTLTGTLAGIAEQVARAGLKPPSLIIIGECIRQREQIAWFERRPLLGHQIGITRPVEQAGPEIERCLDLGAQPVLMPLIEIEPPADWSSLDATIEKLNDFDWLIFTSVNGARAFFNRLWEVGLDSRAVSRLKLAAIGPTTAEALEEYRLRADVVPESYRSEDLAAALAPLVQGSRILWPRASRGRDVLLDSLTSAGATIETVVAYRHIDAECIPAPASQLLTAGQLDWILLSSPAIARRLAALMPGSAKSLLGKRTRLAAISPITAEAAKEAGLPISVVAETYTWAGMWEAVERDEAQRRDM
jgi:uroporphyrinogen III methyltransferase/synthase